MAGRTRESHKAAGRSDGPRQRQLPTADCFFVAIVRVVVCFVHVLLLQYTTALQPRGALGQRCRLDLTRRSSFGGEQDSSSTLAVFWCVSCSRPPLDVTPARALVVGNVFAVCEQPSISLPNTRSGGSVLMADCLSCVAFPDSLKVG